MIFDKKQAGINAPISESLFDVDSGLEHIKWYIDNVEKIVGEKRILLMHKYTIDYWRNCSVYF